MLRLSVASASNNLIDKVNRGNSKPDNVHCITQCDYLFTVNSLVLLVFKSVCCCLFSVNFDHFQILRAIGKGSFGKVSFCRVVDSIFTPQVDLKCICQNTKK